MSRILTLTATGLAGLVLGAGIGVAAAGQDPAATRPERPAAPMDEVHADMADEMPAGLREQCDRMHAAMGDMTDLGAMMGSMAPRSGGAAGMPAGHAAHHPGAEG